MGPDPKNMSNAIKMETKAEEQDMVVRHPMYNGKAFPHTRDFFEMLRKVRPPPPPPQPQLALTPPSPHRARSRTN